jgi:hypothetical protein
MVIGIILVIISVALISLMVIFTPHRMINMDMIQDMIQDIILCGVDISKHPGETSNSSMDLLCRYVEDGTSTSIAGPPQACYAGQDVDISKHPGETSNSSMEEGLMVDYNLPSKISDLPGNSDIQVSISENILTTISDDPISYPTSPLNNFEHLSRCTKCCQQSSISSDYDSSDCDSSSTPQCIRKTHSCNEDDSNGIDSCHPYIHGGLSDNIQHEFPYRAPICQPKVNFPRPFGEVNFDQRMGGKVEIGNSVVNYTVETQLKLRCFSSIVVFSYKSTESESHNSIYKIGNIDSLWSEVKNGVSILEVNGEQSILAFSSQYDSDEKIMTFFVEDTNADILILPVNVSIKITMIINGCIQDIITTDNGIYGCVTRMDNIYISR